MSQTTAKNNTRRQEYQDSPIAWFGELVFAAERNDFSRAVLAQQQLDRLGWAVVKRPEPIRRYPDSAEPIRRTEVPRT